jgi:Bcr/CflA subfamily drug resistance transporter
MSTQKRSSSSSSISNFKFILILLLIACVTQFSTDIYLPSIPAISKYFAASISASQWTIPIFMIGLAVSQLFYGPISDGIGRHKPLLFGLSVALVGTVLCVFATSIQMLLAARLLQGLGVGACSSLWRSIFRDSFEGDEMAKYLSYCIMAFVFVGPAVPVVGGYLQHYIGWRANFVALFFYIVITFIVVIFILPETNKHTDKNKLKLKYIYSSYKELLTSRVFIINSLFSFLVCGGTWGWITTAPVILMEHANLSAIYFGWVMLFSAAIPFALSGYTNAKLVKKFGTGVMLCFGWLCILVAGLLMLLADHIFGVNLWSVILPIMLFYFGSMYIYPNAFARSFKPFAHIAGVAGALYSGFQLLGAAIFSAVMAHLPSSTPDPLALVFLLVAVVSFILFLMKKT